MGYYTGVPLGRSPQGSPISVPHGGHQGWSPTVGTHVGSPRGIPQEAPKGGPHGGTQGGFPWWDLRWCPTWGFPHGVLQTGDPTGDNQTGSPRGVTVVPRFHPGVQPREFHREVPRGGSTGSGPTLVGPGVFPRRWSPGSGPPGSSTECPILRDPGRFFGASPLGGPRLGFHGDPTRSPRSPGGGFPGRILSVCTHGVCPMGVSPEGDTGSVPRVGPGVVYWGVPRCGNPGCSPRGGFQGGLTGVVPGVSARSRSPWGFARCRSPCRVPRVCYGCVPCEGSRILALLGWPVGFPGVSAGLFDSVGPPVVPIRGPAVNPAVDPRGRSRGVHRCVHTGVPHGVR